MTQRAGAGQGRGELGHTLQGASALLAPSGPSPPAGSEVRGWEAAYSPGLLPPARVKGPASREGPLLGVCLPVRSFPAPAWAGGGWDPGRQGCELTHLGPHLPGTCFPTPGLSFPPLGLSFSPLHSAPPLTLFPSLAPSPSPILILPPLHPAPPLGLSFPPLHPGPPLDLSFPPLIPAPPLGLSFPPLIPAPPLGLSFPPLTGKPIGKAWNPMDWLLLFIPWPGKLRHRQTLKSAGMLHHFIPACLQYVGSRVTGTGPQVEGSQPS